MKSLSAPVKTRTADVVCILHGQQIVEQISVYADFTEPVCPICDRQARDKAEAELAERKADERRQMEQRMVEYQLGRAMIPVRFRDRDFSTYEADSPGKAVALDICRRYAENFPEMRKRGASIILCGNTGTGKTHLANAIALKVISEHKKTALYITVGRALRQVKQTFSRDSKETEQHAIETFGKPDLLILDEVGVQYGSDTEKNILFEIINERYEAMKPTILISNLALDALKEYTGDRVLDRMKENGGKLIVFDWKSKRGEG